jgi:pilus assembly protein CpaF
MKGLYALVRTLTELLGFGVPVDRVVPVINRAPRSPRPRAELTAALTELLSASAGVAADRLVSPLYLPERRVDEALRDGVALPAPLPALTARAVTPCSSGRPTAPRDDRLPRARRAGQPVRLHRPGTAALVTEPLSPLVEIERRVLQRAKDETLDLDAADAAARVRRFVVEEVDRWSLDFKHGLRPFDLPSPELVVERAERNLLGYGPLEPLLDDDDVWEIMINAPDQIFVKRHRGRLGLPRRGLPRRRARHPHADQDPRRRVAVAPQARPLRGAPGRPARLRGPPAHRPPGRRPRLAHDRQRAQVHRGGVPVAGRARRARDDAGQVGEFLRAAARANLSTVFAGPPGSGKTTLLSCCTAELDPTLRVVTAEEVFEVDVPLPNVASMQTRAARPDRPEIDLRRLVAGFLRMAPDVAIVGEVRDREALPLLLTLSSGVKGFTTIHAGSARQALSRLRFICQLADTRSELPMLALNSLVTEAIDIVVHSSRVDGVPQVNEVLAVEDQQTGEGASAFTVTELFRRERPDAPLHLDRCGPRPLRPVAGAAGYDVRELLDVDRRLGATPYEEASR